MLHLMQRGQLARLAMMLCIGLVLQQDVQLCQHWSTMMAGVAEMLLRGLQP